MPTVEHCEMAAAYRTAAGLTACLNTALQRCGGLDGWIMLSKVCFLYATHVLVLGTNKAAGPWLIVGLPEHVDPAMTTQEVADSLSVTQHLLRRWEGYQLLA